MFNNFLNKQSNSIYRAGNASFGMKIYFSAIALILSVIAFLFIFNLSKNYTSKISIIFIPRNEKTALMSEQILGNIIAIPKQSSFLAQNNQNATADSFKIEREGTSSIINIKLKRKTPEEAKTVSEATVSALFNTLSHYYDIKNDVDFRIIDGPTVSPTAGNLPLIILISVLLGTIASIIINFISYSVSKFFEAKQEEASTGFKWSVLEKKPVASVMPMPKPKEIPQTQEKPAPQEKPTPEKKETKTEEYKVLQSVVITPIKKSSAPGNLSFIDEEYFRTVIIKQPKKESVEKEPAIEKISALEIPKENELTETPAKETPNPQREPTQEELKKRLNQLLRGEL
ncbi:MAG: hypothetical protein Q7S18_02515 [bacterium]|nr:hypothetical protein [bacterium]